MATTSSREMAAELPSSSAYRIRAASDPLHRLLRWLFYALFCLGLIWLLVDTWSVRLVIKFGSSQLREIDFVVLAFLGVWAVRVVLRGQVLRAGMNWPLFGLLFLLLMPVSIGLAVGKPVTTVLRDVRVPIYYATILPMLAVLCTYGDLRRLQRFVVIVGLLSMGTSIGSWLVGRFTSAAQSEIQRNGIASLNAIGVWLLFIAVASLFIGDFRPPVKRWAGVVLGLGLIQTYVANDIRSSYVGVTAGLLFFVVAPWLWHQRSRSAAVLRKRSLRWGIIVCGLLLALTSLIGLSIAWSGLEIRDIIANNMTLRRFYSLIDPTIETLGSQNREDRLLAVSYGLELGLSNYGLSFGYGDNSFVNLDSDQIFGLIRRNRLEDNPGNVVEGLLFFHNAYGWAFGRLGFWVAVLYFLIVLAIIVRAWRAAWKTRLVELRVFLFATLAFAIYILVSGFGGGGFFDYFGPGMIFWLIALAVLLRGTALAKEG